MPIKNTPVEATAATSPHPNSSIIPFSAELDAADANVRLRVKIDSWTITQALYAPLQFCGLAGSAGSNATYVGWLAASFVFSTSCGCAAGGRNALYCRHASIAA
jgi:hypothetical protein